MWKPAESPTPFYPLLLEINNLPGFTAIDGDSLDVLMSGGLTRDETNTEYVLSTSLGAVVESQLTVTIDTAGNSKTGVVYIYIR